MATDQVQLGGAVTAARVLVLTLGVSVLAGLGAGCSGGGAKSCAVGSESCACTSGGACDPGLSCLSSTCVKPSGSDGGADSTTAPPPAAECVTDVYCARDAKVAPCTSGYDCNTTFLPPRCTRLYCGAAGTACSADVQCAVGLLCNVDHACGPDLSADFIGDWVFSSGTQSVACSDGSGTSAALTQDEHLPIVHGLDSPLLVQWNDSPPCNLKFDVQETVATVRPGQSCQVGSSTQTFGFFTLVLSASRTQLVYQESDTVADPPLLCQYTAKGQLRRP